jgi:histidinol-phosphate aminotransferase
MFAVELTERIAEHHALTPGQVVVGGGSVGVLGHILQAYTSPGDQVVFAWRSFEAYPILTQVAGATPVPVPLTADARHDVPALTAAVNERTKVLLLCSPNNPTGPTIRQEEFDAVMRAVPEHVLVVLDEAYVEFVTDSATVDGRAALDAYPNLMVLRTFSKAFGLAGLRVGYLAANPSLVDGLRRIYNPKSVNTLGQIGAVAALDDLEYLNSFLEEV